jgi:hypothetical protein
MHGNQDQHDSRKGLRRDDVVTVGSLEEILATLDADGKYEGMPFMPEMAAFCGKAFPVSRLVEKTCVEGVGMRTVRETVFLDSLRCDGSAHDGCQRGCMLFWKEAWLQGAGSIRQGTDGTEAAGGTGEDLGDAAERSRRPFPPVRPIQNVSQLPTARGDRFCCQSTELAQATTEFPPGKWQCYLHDLRVGEITLRRFAYILWRSLTNRVWKLLRGRAYYELSGDQKKTLTAELNLQPGEWVEVKSAAEIQATLDTKGRNRGLVFDPEMAICCGRRYRVAAPLRKIISEETGKMVALTNTVILDGLTCQGICAQNCPRANYFYWREIWLKRV